MNSCLKAWWDAPRWGFFMSPARSPDIHSNGRQQKMRGYHLSWSALFSKEQCNPPIAVIKPCWTSKLQNSTHIYKSPLDTTSDRLTFFVKFKLPTMSAMWHIKYGDFRWNIMVMSTKRRLLIASLWADANCSPASFMKVEHHPPPPPWALQPDFLSTYCTSALNFGILKEVSEGDWD